MSSSHHCVLSSIIILPVASHYFDSMKWYNRICYGTNYKWYKALYWWLDQDQTCGDWSHQWFLHCFLWLKWQWKSGETQWNITSQHIAVWLWCLTTNFHRFDLMFSSSSSSSSCSPRFQCTCSYRSLNKLSFASIIY